MLLSAIISAPASGAAGGPAAGASGGGGMSTPVAGAALTAASAAAAWMSSKLFRLVVSTSSTPWKAWSTTSFFDLALCDAGAAMHWCTPDYSLRRLRRNLRDADEPFLAESLVVLLSINGSRCPEAEVAV